MFFQPCGKRKRNKTDGVMSLPKKRRVFYEVIVRNLCFQTTADTLKHSMSTFGKILDIRMPCKSKLNPENKGFAYITFADMESKEQALAQNSKLEVSCYYSAVIVSCSCYYS